MKIVKTVIFFVTFLLFFCMKTMTVSADELYFNKDGDLVFSTYDKKASSDTMYRTMGWIIKHYDDSIWASNQNNATVPKSGYMYSWEDPNNRDYIYTTFIIPGSSILPQIEKASPAWKEQILTYGGYVYIDSILTIVENGVEQGYLDNQGNYHGELYNTYDGIRNARGWADGDRLTAYYGLKVKYPYEVKPLEQQIVITSVKKHIDSPEPEINLAVGAENYDVVQGIPSGEKLDVTGCADSFRYSVSYQRVNGYINVPVKVASTYHLKWTDSGGIKHSEKQNVERWYYVRKDFSYTELLDAEIYNLAEGVYKGDCFSKVELKNLSKKYSCVYKKFGGKETHVASNKTSEYADVKEIVVNSSNNQRPYIPNDNQQEIANGIVKDVTVWNDSLTINGKVLLSSEKKNKNTEEYKTYGERPKQSVTRAGNVIYPEEKNGEGKAVNATFLYAAGNKKVYTDVEVGTVTVHTPVVTKVSVLGNKWYNESVAPTENQVVLGQSVQISTGNYGTHRDIKGYGTRNYSNYIRKQYVSFTCPVIYQDKYYGADSWIELQTSVATLEIPPEAGEGNYQVKSLVFAKNAEDYEGRLGEAWNDAEAGANTSINKYIAVSQMDIQAIGKIYGLTVSNEGCRIKSGSQARFPEHISCAEGLLPMQSDKISTIDDIYKIQLYAAGIGDEPHENIEMNLSYDIVQNGKRKSVDVYYAADDSFSADTLTKLAEKVNLSADSAVWIDSGIYRYDYELYIPDRLVVVEAGRDLTDINRNSSYIIRGQDILVNADVYADSYEEKKLSYENEKNAARGYCNMWRTEGYKRDQYPEIPLKYGDILLLGTASLYEESFRVIGTH